MIGGIFAGVLGDLLSGLDAIHEEQKAVFYRYLESNRNSELNFSLFTQSSLPVKFQEKRILQDEGFF